VNDFDDYGGCLFDEEYYKEEAYYEKERRKKENIKRRWENGYQKWCNKMSQSKEDKPLGCCCCGAACGYCIDNHIGRPCVRALNELCRMNNLKIDYTKTSYEDAWWGRLEND